MTTFFRTLLYFIDKFSVKKRLKQRSLFKKDIKMTDEILAENWFPMTTLPSNPNDKCYLIICFVCRDVAKPGQEHLRNYGGIVCYSCRAFWRRSHQATRCPTFTCKKNGNCIMTVNTRRRCQKCRYDKCIAAGMRSEAVLNESQKKIRFRKLFMKRQKLLAKQLKAQKLSEVKTKKGPKKVIITDILDDRESLRSFESNPSSEESVESRNHLWIGSRGYSSFEYPKTGSVEFYHNSMELYRNSPNDLLNRIRLEQENSHPESSLKHEYFLIEEESSEAKTARITDAYIDVMNNFRFVCKIT